MTQKTDNYNLLEKEWIPVIRNNGQTERVGIRRALVEAGSIRQIAASNPMDRVAILRFLLALLYWCRGNPEDHANVNSEGSFPPDWFTKLDEHRELFDLLGDRHRFYQCAPVGSGRSPEKLSANYLVHEIPTGTNKWHFRHSTDRLDGLCPACCATGLLRLPLFATSGGRGKPPGINAKPPIYFIPTGSSLAATLRLSWLQVPELGKPAWEVPDQQLPKAEEVPLLAGLTWLPRRVWLEDPEEIESRCISCGSRGPLIRQSVFAGIGSTRTDDGAAGRIWSDPHVAYSSTTKGDLISLHASDVLGASDAAAGQWTKFMAGMLLKQEAFDDMRTIWVVGFSTVQNDKYLEALEHTIASPTTPHEIKETFDKIASWQKEGSKLSRRLKPPNTKESSRKHVQIPPIVAAIRPHVEGMVSAKVEELLTGGNAAWEQASNEYRPMMRAVGKSLAPGFTTEALRWRNQIAAAAPNMRPKAESTKKSRSKKGDEK